MTHTTIVWKLLYTAREWSHGQWSWFYWSQRLWTVCVLYWTGLWRPLDWDQELNAAEAKKEEEGWRVMGWEQSAEFVLAEYCWSSWGWTLKEWLSLTVHVTVHCQDLTSLYTVNSRQLTGNCALCNVHCALCTVNCAVLTVHCWLFTTVDFNPSLCCWHLSRHLTFLFPLSTPFKSSVYVGPSS